MPTSSPKPWKCSEAATTVMAARKHALRDSLAATDFRLEAVKKLWPAVLRSGLHDDAKALMKAFLGLEDIEQPFLPNNRELARVVCLTRANTHVLFCQKLIWAFCDPAARRYVDPRLYRDASQAKASAQAARGLQDVQALEGEQPPYRPYRW